MPSLFVAAAVVRNNHTDHHHQQLLIVTLAGVVQLLLWYWVNVRYSYYPQIRLVTKKQKKMASLFGTPTNATTTNASLSTSASTCDPTVIADKVSETVGIFLILLVFVAVINIIMTGMLIYMHAHGLGDLQTQLKQLPGYGKTMYPRPQPLRSPLSTTRMGSPTQMTMLNRAPANITTTTPRNAVPKAQLGGVQMTPFADTVGRRPTSNKVKAPATYTVDGDEDLDDDEIRELNQAEAALAAVSAAASIGSSPTAGTSSSANSSNNNNHKKDTKSPTELFGPDDHTLELDMDNNDDMLDDAESELNDMVRGNRKPAPKTKSATTATTKNRA